MEYQESLLTRRVSIPMIHMGGNVQSILSESLSFFEGKCVEEGYIKKGSIEIVQYSCGIIQGRNVQVQVVFTCKIANPLPGQTFTCTVETITRAGITAKLESLIVFLARDHHNMSETFSNIKEHDTIKVTVVGQRFEPNDPAIYVIATLSDEYPEPTNTEPTKIDILLQRQFEHCPKILEELKKNGRKTTHWAWWIFPTEKEGVSEPFPKTCVTKETAMDLIQRAPPQWKEVLEEIADLSDAHPKGIAGILPESDLDRVNYFITFWSTIQGTPSWLDDILPKLNRV
jgi:DNA-directed RNA polymerase subunit E'/Rpb7